MREVRVSWIISVNSISHLRPFKEPLKSVLRASFRPQKFVFKLENFKALKFQVAFDHKISKWKLEIESSWKVSINSSVQNLDCWKALQSLHLKLLKVSNFERPATHRSESAQPGSLVSASDSAYRPVGSAPSRCCSLSGSSRIARQVPMLLGMCD